MANKYSDTNYERIKSEDIKGYIPGLGGRGRNMYIDCPFCGDAKGMKLDLKHNLLHCFKCDNTISGAIGAVMHFQKVDAGTAIDIIANDLGIETESQRRASAVESAKAVQQKSFCEKQLEASGLTIEDVTATVEINNSTLYQPTFRKGGWDKAGNINDTDDEMLIYYYDLSGRMMTYVKSSNKVCPYVRIRWSNPAAHTDKEGKEAKYMSQKGAPARLYITEMIRRAYKQGEHIETLVIQEGEKKAEKACKHGIPSVAIQGIYNIGKEESGLLKELQYIVQKCTVKNVVLLFDSDWDHLSRSLEQNSKVDARPMQFAGAAIKFKQYVQTLHGVGVSVDIYVANINENDRGDKGIDDLLVGELKGREPELKEDICRALYTHDGKGQYVTMRKVTGKTDNQIRDFWLLNDPKAFFEKHHKRLVNLNLFRFGMMQYKVEDGAIKIASKSSDKEFWYVTIKENGKDSVEFDTVEALQYINESGFYRIRTLDLDVDAYKFVRIDGGIVYNTGQVEIRNFIWAYVMQATKRKSVLNFFASRLDSLLNLGKLERIGMIEDNFDNFTQNMQKFYFTNGQVEVTAAGISFSEKILDIVWEDRVQPRVFKRVPLIKSIELLDSGYFDIELTEKAAECEFLSFIRYTSDFWGKSQEQMTIEERGDLIRHVVNKITSIGYLLNDFKEPTESCAVIAMDGQLGDVGQSNGRTGKSLVGKAISYILRQTYIDGRNTKNDDDFIFSNVTARTRNIFFDDVRVNFDFDRFFGVLTGDMVVNPKGDRRFTIRNEKSPKIYITTNHAVNTTSRSSKDRIIYMAFSNHYNDKYSPMDDFGHQLFVDWDDSQWNLFYNFMIECAWCYLVSMSKGWVRRGRGAVRPPMQDIELRTYKQLMGEAFYQWAEVFYDPTGKNIGERIPRKDLFENYHKAFPDSKFGVTPANFRKKLEYYCTFKGYHYNPSKKNEDSLSFTDFRLAYPGISFIGGPDKSGSVEYITVVSNEKLKETAMRLAGNPF